MHEATRSAGKPQAVDNTDWLKGAAIVAASVGHIGFFFMEDDYWWSVVGRLAAPTLFFFAGYAQSRDRPTSLDLARFHPDIARQLECRLDLGGRERLLQLRTYPHFTSLCGSASAHYGWVAFAFVVSALVAALPDSFAGGRLRRGRMVVDFIRIAPPHACRQQIDDGRERRNTRLGSACARFGNENRTNAPARLRHRRGRICLAGTEGVCVFSASVGRRHSRRRLLVRLLLLVREAQVASSRQQR